MCVVFFVMRAVHAVRYIFFFLSVPPNNTILECVDIERAFFVLF